MIIETLTDSAAAICLHPDEVPGEVCPERMCALVRRAQAERGMRLWKSMEADVFLYGERILLLARPVETECFAFDDFELLLSAAFACPESLGSSLTYLDGLWLLRVNCPGGRVPAALGEYGQRLEGGEGLAAHLAEHGELLISGSAVETLRRFFLRV